MIVENSMHIFLLYVILPPFSFDSPISKIELFSFDSPIWVDILGIVWTALRFPCRVTSLGKDWCMYMIILKLRIIINEMISKILLLGHCTMMK